MIYARHHRLRLHYAVHLALWIRGRSYINSSPTYYSHLPYHFSASRLLFLSKAAEVGLRVDGDDGLYSLKRLSHMTKIYIWDSLSYYSPRQTGQRSKTGGLTWEWDADMHLQTVWTQNNMSLSHAELCNHTHERTTTTKAYVCLNQHV